MKSKLYSKDHDLFRDSVIAYLEQEVAPHYDEWEAQKCVPKSAWLAAGENGFLCPTAPQAYGGLEVDWLYSIILAEEIARMGFLGLFWPLHSEIVYPYFATYGTDEQKERWIPACVSGEKISAVAMTEPSVGTDLANLKTKAVRNGDHYIVNGSKTFISNGQMADLIVVAVKTADTEKPHQGISLLVIESDMPGFSRGRNLDKIGLHAQDTSELFFEDCQVPVSNLLGEEGKGFRYLMEKLQQERLILAIQAAAAAQGALEHTVNYVKTREAFGKPISQFQNTRFELAQMATQVQLAKSFLEDLIPRHLAGDSVVQEVSMAKYWMTDIQFDVANRGLQLFGGYGYMTEYPISRYFLDARVQQIYGGTNEIMKELIARHLGLDE